MSFKVPSMMTHSLTRLLDTGPAEGSSHVWMLRVANELARIVDRDTCERILAELAGELIHHRRVPADEITRQVDSAYRTWTRGHRWPPIDLDHVEHLLVHTPEVRQQVVNINTKEHLSAWFRPQSYLCVTNHPARTNIIKFEEIGTEMSRFSYMTPNPLVLAEGRRCESNILHRDYLVMESDVYNRQEQAKLLKELDQYVKLIFTVFSGGKSLHGWFDVRQLTQTEIKDFFAYGMKLGFDRHMFSSAQLCRVPGGLRDNNMRQDILQLERS